MGIKGVMFCVGWCWVCDVMDVCDIRMCDVYVHTSMMCMVCVCVLGVWYMYMCVVLVYGISVRGIWVFMCVIYVGCVVYYLEDM